MLSVPFLLHDVISPIFMFYFFPPLLGLAAAANLLIDTLVFFLAIKFFSIHIAWRKALRMLVALWMIGLVADIGGSLFLTSIGTVSLKTKTRLIDYYSIYSSPVSILFFAAAVVLSGFIIYWLDLIYLKGHLSKKQATRIALIFALLAAPYSFLIPTSWIY